MKYITTITLILILLLINSGKVFSQEDLLLNRSLEMMTQASITGNSEVLMKYTSPRLIKVMGGEEDALKLFKKMFSELKESYKISIDSVVNYNLLKINKLGTLKYKFIPQIIVMSQLGRNDIIIKLSNLLAIHENSSIGWKFIDINNMDEGQLNYILPEFKNSVQLIKKFEDKPILTSKQNLKHELRNLEKVIESQFSSL